jgi:hypothetical protein
MRDALFYRFIIGLFILMILYGAGMLIVILWGDHVLASKMLNAFAAMFSGTLGLGAGYLLGKNGGGNNGQ